MASDNISVIKARDVLMVTMPANPDDATVSLFQAKVLEAMDRHQSRGLVLDISLVETLDSFFARTVVETAQMIGLMGGQMVVAGMRPSVAITATQLGLTLGSAVAALDVDQALNLLEGPETGKH
jgi:rsbT antagonist protein RsbS